MSKLNASFFRRMTLGMAIVSGILMAMEDEKLTKEEIVMLLNQLFQGLGTEIDFKGLQFDANYDGSLSITVPPEVVKKLEFKF